MKNITIKDIAKEAGVSVATVSRVINGNSSVAPIRKDKVESVIKKYGYIPNLVARGLKVDSTQTIAVLISDGTNEYFGEIIKAIEDVIREENYTLFVCNSLNDKSTELKYLQLLAERKVDGIIVNVSGHNNERIAQLSNQIPIVLLHRKINYTNFKGDFIDADFGKSCYDLTMDLIGYGHRNIGIISGPLFISTAHDRFVNFQRAMKTIGKDVDSNYEYFIEGPFTSGFGYLAAKQIMSMQNPPTALVVMHCETTIGALRYFRSHNISVPDDVSLVSPSNISFSDLFYVQPRHAVPSTWALGRRAGEMILERIRSNNDILNREVFFTPTIIPGNSILSLHSR